MNADEARASILELPDAVFVARHIIETIPYAFDGDRHRYIEWKSQLGDLIKIDPACVVIVGSAALGVSLNPKHLFREFRAASDIDTAIISQTLFEDAWRNLRENRARYVAMGKKLARSVKAHRSYYVFDGVIDTRDILPALPFGKQWLGATVNMSDLPPTDSHKLTFRLYRDFEGLREYHVRNVNMIKAQLEAQ